MGEGRFGGVENAFLVAGAEAPILGGLDRPGVGGVGELSEPLPQRIEAGGPAHAQERGGREGPAASRGEAPLGCGHELVAQVVRGRARLAEPSKDQACEPHLPNPASGPPRPTMRATAPSVSSPRAATPRSCFR